MDVAAEEPVMLTDEGEKLQFIMVVPVQQDRLIAPTNPFRGVNVIVELPDCPGAEIMMVDGFAAML